MNQKHTFFITCAPGIEPVLHREARELKLPKAERQVGGVFFKGTMKDAWRANMEMRTAVRVLRRLERFEAPDDKQLYKNVRRVDWSKFLSADGTFFVDAQCKESALDHTQYVAQRVKDGVVDGFRAATGRRPKVAKEGADLRIHVHIWRDRCILSVDTSGDSLHKRGWRQYQGRAPLAETLAAAVVMLSGWDKQAPLVDLFCGSGTLLIEAAMMAANVPPGGWRKFGFENWADHNADAYRRFKEQRITQVRRAGKLRFQGRDLNVEHVAGAEINAEAAGVEDWINFERGNAFNYEAKAGWNGFMISNMPYGVRVGDPVEIEAMHHQFGAQLRRDCRGYRASLLTGDRRLAHALGFEKWDQISLQNGSIQCKLVNAEL
ncbi:MAG: RNA methyltransferase [Planctomycetes bacterium]|nr:RNA methyltransferase [Planctomycetota bacterium]